MSNANFGGMTGTPPADLAAYAVEQSVSKDWVNILAKSSPFLAFMMGSGRFNKSGQIAGRKIISPVIFSEADIQFAGVTDANQFTALTPTATSGATQAEAHLAHYRGAYHLTETEKQLLSGPIGTYRGDVLKQKKKAVESVVQKFLATTTVGTQADSRTAHLGILRAVNAADQTVCGIDQAVTTAWRNVRDTAGGQIGLTRIDNILDLVDDGPGMGGIDIVLCSKAVSSGPNIYGAIRNLIGSSEIIVNNESKTAKFGFRGYEYAGIQFLGDQFIPNGANQGRVIGLDSTSWHIRGNATPSFHPSQRLPGTDAYEYMFTHWFGMLCDNPGANFLISGLSG